MIPYEFVTTISKSGKVTIPSAYNWQIPKDKLVRVVIWVDESSSVNGIEAKDESLEELIGRIQQTPINPALMTPASGLLAEHLARPAGAPDPDFDETVWNKEWATIEAEMDALEAAKEATMLKDFEE